MSEGGETGRGGVAIPAQKRICVAVETGEKGSQSEAGGATAESKATGENVPDTEQKPEIEGGQEGRKPETGDTVGENKLDTEHKPEVKDGADVDTEAGSGEAGEVVDLEHKKSKDGGVKEEQEGHEGQ